jgi:acetylornithine deacetylase/succinyl-diaminopimelate desuccinylase-like protein
MVKAAWETYATEHRTRYIDQLLDFLRIPSVSALPEHAADVQRAAQWVADRLRAAGMDVVRIMPTGGHPVVYGSWLHAPGKRTILIYGHFDTQPADPLDVWTTPPFDPDMRNGRVYARGASDDKGNMLIPILAVEALLQTSGTLPVNVKFFFEGQEEVLSPQLPTFIAAHTDLLACDLVLSADSSQFSEDQPSLMIGCRGICGLQIDVRGAATDLHSGVFGGAVANPIHALAHILASMHNEDGSVRVDGFYDDVVPVTAEDRSAIAAIPLDEDALRGQLGIDAFVGEPGYTANERRWARPTLEVNGIWGGFQGEDLKTVLPSEAHAKISCRLVSNQDPARVAELVAVHAKRHAPAGVTVTARPFGARAHPYLMPVDHWGNQAAAHVLTELYGIVPYVERSGGSLPVCDLFLRMLGAYTVGFGFGHDDENAHAPNEFFRLRNLERGLVAYGKLLHLL